MRQHRSPFVWIKKAMSASTVVLALMVLSSPLAAARGPYWLSNAISGSLSGNIVESDRIA
jgi:hypothetical protein